MAKALLPVRHCCAIQGGECSLQCVCMHERVSARSSLTPCGAAAQFTAVLAGLGVGVKPFVLNYTTPASDIILAVMATEAAANFDYWQRSGAEDTNRRQDFWPPLLRLARMIPAVEYIQVAALFYFWSYFEM